MRLWQILALALTLSGCVQEAALQPLPPAKGPGMQTSAALESRARAKVLLFQQAAQNLEPVAEALCQARHIARNCRFQMVVDPRLGLPPNAYQTLDARGRPVVAMTLALLADARNEDEIAFVLGHEAAHHILGHLAQQASSAMAAAKAAGEAAAAKGATLAEIRKAQAAGAAAGSLVYAKDLELQADALGAEIAYRAGFNPLRGAAYFDRLPEPGRGFRNTHPGNHTRKALVAKVVARLRRTGT